MPKKHIGTILIVEDDRALLQIISKQLEDHNFIVLTARSAKEAKEQVKKTKQIDVMWIDHFLIGEESGLDFLADVKSLEQTKDSLVYVVSNTDYDNKKSFFVKYLKLGIKNYFVKSDHKLSDIVQLIIKDLKQV